LIGDFDKPKYFALDNTLCAHQQHGVSGCHRCIEVCATDAISSVNGRVEVNPCLCQGCGDCSSICPSGAISYQYPDLETLLQTLKNTLSDHSGSLLFYSGEAPAGLPANSRPFKLEALGVLNLAICLNAIAYGAERILIHDDNPTPETRRVLDEVISQSNTLLAAMGWGDQRVVLTRLDQLP
jgi:ferredoxin